VKKIIVLALSALVLAGCTSTAPVDLVVGPVTEYQVQEPARPLDCSGARVTPDAMSNPRPVTALSPDFIADLEGTGWLDRPIADWTVADETEETVTLWRELGRDESGGHLHYDHAFVTFERTWAAAGWSLAGGGSCSLLLDVGELHNAAVTLDPAHLPDPRDTSIHLLVTESGCASGRDAEGRIEILEVNDFRTVVEFVIAVRPITDAVAFCPGHPATPVEVKLAYPLSNRILMDGARIPATEIALPECPSLAQISDC